MLSDKELLQVIKTTKSSLKAKTIEKVVSEFPQSLLVFRLALGKSQRDFIDFLDNIISQVMLIRHENGKTKRISKRKAKAISKKLEKINLNFKEAELLKTYKNFLQMQRGSLTPERARKLQLLWQQKTTKEQRSVWGRMGARKALQKQRLTPTEKKIKEILEELKLSYQHNTNITTNEGIILNIDFLVKIGDQLIAIEVTERIHNLTIVSQALAFRIMKLKEKYSNLFFIVVTPKKIPLIGLEILKKTSDALFFTNELNSLKTFLMTTLSS